MFDSCQRAYSSIFRNCSWLGLINSQSKSPSTKRRQYIFTAYTKGRTIRKVMGGGGGGKFFMFAFFFQVVSCVCMFFLNMSSRMQFFFPIQLYKC